MKKRKLPAGSFNHSKAIKITLKSINKTILIIKGVLKIFSSDIFFLLLRFMPFTLANKCISIYMATTEKIIQTRLLKKLVLDA